MALSRARLGVSRPIRGVGWAIRGAIGLSKVLMVAVGAATLLRFDIRKIGNTCRAAMRKHHPRFWSCIVRIAILAPVALAATGCPLVLIPGLMGCRFPPSLRVDLSEGAAPLTPTFHIRLSFGKDLAKARSLQVTDLDSPEQPMWAAESSSAATKVEHVTYGACPDGFRETAAARPLQPEHVYIVQLEPGSTGLNRLGEGHALFLFRQAPDGTASQQLLVLRDWGGLPCLAARLDSFRGPIPRFRAGYVVCGGTTTPGPIERIEVREFGTQRPVWICEAPLPRTVNTPLEYGSAPQGFHELIAAEKLADATIYELKVRSPGGPNRDGSLRFTFDAPADAPHEVPRWRELTDAEDWATEGYHWDPKRRELQFPGWEKVDQERKEEALRQLRDGRRAKD